MTVGEYTSIFLHHSLLTLSYLCNFTLRALHALLIWGFRPSNARILRPGAGPSTLLRRRFLGPAAPEVPWAGHSGGSPVQMRPRFISSAASFEHPPSWEGSKVPSFLASRPPPLSQSLHMLNISRGVSTLVFLRILRTYGCEGPLGEGYPSSPSGGRMQPTPNSFK